MAFSDYFGAGTKMRTPLIVAGAVAFLSLVGGAASYIVHKLTASAEVTDCENALHERADDLEKRVEAVASCRNLNIFLKGLNPEDYDRATLVAEYLGLVRIIRRNDPRELAKARQALETRFGPYVPDGEHQRELRYLAAASRQVVRGRERVIKTVENIGPVSVIHKDPLIPCDYVTLALNGHDSEVLRSAVGMYVDNNFNTRNGTLPLNRERNTSFSDALLWSICGQTLSARKDEFSELFLEAYPGMRNVPSPVRTVTLKVKIKPASELASSSRDGERERDEEEEGNE